ncbi:hypothetical protein Bca52824_044854 [Brassica carinata]|uniref:F-box associated domain-containing protein n=1 Tax=Brassica carinata TaxID=52824 RepID=A0A8X7RDR9_BRACI|nr:hypothetical protein Bca52824_044854 [Brassica carinata]
MLRLGLLMSSENSGYASRSCKSFKLWVLRDAATLEWSKRVYIRPDIERIEKWVLRIAYDDEKNPYLPKSAARATVPGGPSVPCSTAKAVEWDAAWSQNLDLSGCAALGVHVAAYEEDKAEGTRPKKLQAEKTAEGIV